MNDFTKEELEDIFDLVETNCFKCILEDIEDVKDYWIPLKKKLQSMIDNFCEHKWKCFDDVQNTRECIKCGENREGEIT